MTFVNALQRRGHPRVSSEVTRASESPNHRSVVDVKAVFADGSSHNVSGTLSGPREVEKIVNINGRSFDLRAEGQNLLVSYADKPGSLGKIATALGENGIDIQAAALSQDAEGEGATVLLRVDRVLPDDLVAVIGASVDAGLVKAGGPVNSRRRIGPEVVAQGLRVLEKLDPTLSTTEYDFGARRYHATGELLTDADLASLREHDAILLGAIGDPSVPSGVLERGFLLKLRFAMDHHVNLRPSVLMAGVSSPLAGNPSIDFVVVREGTEGPYTGNGGAIRVGTPHEVATEVSVNTRYGIERVVRFAFARAMERGKKLTLVHKNNVLTFAGSMWSRTVDEVGAEFPRSPPTIATSTRQ